MAVPPATRRPTLADVAAAAGVSRATASNAFNRPERLSEQRRQEILALAEQLGYAGPNPAAAGLRRGRAGAIGVVIPDRLSYAFTDPAGVMVLDGLAETLGDADVGLLLLAGDGTGGGPAPEAVMRAAVDGFVVYSTARDDPAVEALRRRRLPVVLVDESPLEDAPIVDVDEESGCRAVANHLLELGHRTFGIITLECRPDGLAGPLTPERRAQITYTVTQRRLDAVLDTLAEAGIDPATVALYEARHNVPFESEAAMEWLMDRSDRPTAVCCHSDQLAIGALTTARRRSLDVPGDVSITGFDDIEPAASTDPPLTTVRQPLRERGRIAGELILAALDGQPRERTRMPTELIVRGSTAPPPRLNDRR